MIVMVVFVCVCVCYLLSGGQKREESAGRVVVQNGGTKTEFGGILSKVSLLAT